MRQDPINGEALKEELDTVFSPKTTELYEAIQSGRLAPHNSPYLDFNRQLQPLISETEIPSDVIHKKEMPGLQELPVTGQVRPTLRSTL
jgi:hypothetical protein